MTSGDDSEALASFEDLESRVAATTEIPVPISYEIIKLFSEGLYQSPQKAVEELVSNSYDAEATHVHIVLPSAAVDPNERLWVIDNGDGLDSAGFTDLWKIAVSGKAATILAPGKRAPIGQFGIGKLASYVLAWRLTHISRANDVVRVTTMNFREIDSRRQNDALTHPYTLGLRELSLEQAKELMSDIRLRSPSAWNMMFNAESTSWTAAALSDFKELYSKLSVGRLKWVLRTALPLVSDFQITVDDEALVSSKATASPLFEYVVGLNDVAATDLGLEPGSDSDGTFVSIPGIKGVLRGSAEVYETKLTEGKSDRWNRSNGFFVRVRGRIINVDDQLFGLPTLNHATWSRFSMQLEVDGLRSHLLSSREGVRESDATDQMRSYLQAVFNRCRRAYDEWLDSRDGSRDVNILLANAPSSYVVEPLIEAVQRAIVSERESFYVDSVPDVGLEEREAWVAAFADAAAKNPFAEVEFQASGVNDRAVRYRPQTRSLLINTDHPFIAKLLSAERGTRTAASLFASSELLVDVLLQEHSFDDQRVFDMMADRDRVLRLVAGERPTTASEVMRLLKSATEHETALERAVGLAFRALGFEYERRGGNVGGADGVLDGRLGRGAERLEDYRLVYDAKQTKQPSVSADKIDPSSLWVFKRDEKADYAFFIAIAYEAESNPTSKVNKKLENSVHHHQPVTLLKVDHLIKLVSLHYQYGLTLSRLRTLFESAHTVLEVDEWMKNLETEMTEMEPRVPLKVLLLALEAEKADLAAVPTVNAARAVSAELKRFAPERLVASLRAVNEIVGNRFIEVDEVSTQIRLHTSAAQIVAELDRSLLDLFGDATDDGVDSTDWPEER